MERVSSSGLVEAKAGTLVEVIPVLAETARVSVREVESGRVAVHLAVREHDEPVEVMLRQEELAVERVPVGRMVTEAPLPRQEGDTYVIPVLEERLVVEKRLFLKEEIRVRTTSSERLTRELVRLRTEIATVDAGSHADTAPHANTIP